MSAIAAVLRAAVAYLPSATAYGPSVRPGKPVGTAAAHDEMGRDGIPVQSAAELACATTGLGSCARLATFSRMACASSRMAAVD